MLLFLTSSSLNLYKGDATASWVKDTYRKGETQKKKVFLCFSNNINNETLLSLPVYKVLLLFGISTIFLENQKFAFSPERFRAMDL